MAATKADFAAENSAEVYLTMDVIVTDVIVDTMINLAMTCDGELDVVLDS